ncbi:MAG: DMT family transporter [Verrucomicrobia bacterium]|nr:DMT family transporter [Verrucomicrobiota bacterium]
MTRRFLVLSLGVFCASTSVVMTKASQLPPELLAASRLFVAFIALLPFFIRDIKRYPEFTCHKILSFSALPALLLAFHFITWTIGARLTTSANATLIVGLIPVAMPFFAYIVLRESLTIKESIGTALALLGVFVLAYSDFRLSADLLTGDLVCLISMLFLAWYLILARKNKSIPSIWIYLVPLYLVAGVICLVAGLIRTGLPESFPTIELLWILLLGLIPTVFGHSLLNMAMQWFRSQFVAIVNQLEFVYAGLFGYFIFRELPHSSFYLASAIMMAGVFWTVFSDTYPIARNRKPPN